MISFPTLFGMLMGFVLVFCLVFFRKSQAAKWFFGFALAAIVAFVLFEPKLIETEAVSDLRVDRLSSYEESVLSQTRTDVCFQTEQTMQEAVRRGITDPTKVQNMIIDNYLREDDPQQILDEYLRIMMDEDGYSKVSEIPDLQVYQKRMDTFRAKIVTNATYGFKFYVDNKSCTGVNEGGF